MTQVAIQAQDLTLTRRSGWLKPQTVRDHVSFTLPEGAVMGLVGRNGAGKSSLLGNPRWRSATRCASASAMWRRRRTSSMA